MLCLRGRVAEFGLRYLTRNQAMEKSIRGFESLPFRHFFFSAKLGKTLKPSNMRIRTYTLFRRGSVCYAKKVYQGRVYKFITGAKQLTQAQLLAPKLLAERIKGRERQLTVSPVAGHAPHIRSPSSAQNSQDVRVVHHNVSQRARSGAEWHIQEAFCPDSAREFLYAKRRSY